MKLLTIIGLLTLGSFANAHCGMCSASSKKSESSKCESDCKDKKCDKEKKKSDCKKCDKCSDEEEA